MLKLHKPLITLHQAIGLMLTVFLCVWSLPSFSGQVGTPFLVTVKLIPASVQPSLGSSSAFCQNNSLPTAHGALVTVVCSTGAVVGIEPGLARQPFTPLHGGTYRYITQVSNIGLATDTFDNLSGSGTTTAWRLVRLAERDYLEVLLGW
jgi:hypothetical protein